MITAGAETDYLVCGVCQQDFPLTKFPQFVQHKQYECDDSVSQKIFVCKSCPQKFITPWRLLKHAQSDHSIQIYLENAQSEFHELSIRDSGWQKDDDQSNQGDDDAEDRCETENKYVIEFNDESKEQNKSDSSNNDSGDELYIADVDILTNKEKQEDGGEEFREVQDDEVEMSKDDAEEEEELCCSNQDCGVTFMPGTHENLKKCCSSILPKKRKRHMEIKHMTTKGKKRGESSQSRTIYIDLEPTGEMLDSVQAMVSEQDADTPQLSPNNIDLNSEQTSPLSLTSRGTFLLQPGSTYSIPVAYNLNQASNYMSNVTSTATKNRPRSEQNISPQLVVSSTVNSPIVVNNPAVEQSTSGSLLSALPVSMSSNDADLVEAAHALSQLQSQATTILSPQGESRGISEMLAAEQIYLQQQRQAAEEEGKDDLSTSGRKKRKYPTSRPFKCDQCDHSFNQRIHLKKHLSKHTGIKPFKCEQCDYSTVERSHLKVHIRVHTGEKPFKCTFCEYATAQNSTLKIHLKRHHSKATTIACTLCHQAFPQPELAQHLQQHSTRPILQNTPATAINSQQMLNQHNIRAAVTGMSHEVLLPGFGRESPDSTDSSSNSSLLQAGTLLAQLASGANEQSTNIQQLPVMQNLSSLFQSQGCSQETDTPLVDKGQDDDEESNQHS